MDNLTSPKINFSKNSYIEEIFPDLVLIKVPYFSSEGETALVNIYLIIDEELVLIDTGPGREKYADILPISLGQLGFSFQDVSKIIYTHAHADHMGGGVQIQGKGEFSSSVHYEAVKHVEQYGGYIHLQKTNLKQVYFEHLSLYPEKRERCFEFIDSFWQPTSGEININHGLHDAEVIDTGRHKLEVVFTPGHSPWDICLWERKKAILFSGDFLMEKSTTLTGGLNGFGSDLNLYESSLEKIEKYLLKAKFVFPSHGPTIRDGSKLAKNLLGIIKWRENRILKELSTKRCGLVDLVNLFSPGDDPVVFVRQMGVVLTHIEKLEEEGRILRLRDSGQALFALEQ